MSRLPHTSSAWELRPAAAADRETIAELRAVVMRPDLERLGRYDEFRVRDRFRRSFSPEHTRTIVTGGDFAGCVTLRPTDDGLLLEHFYLAPEVQGRGLGGEVLRSLLEHADAEGAPVRLNVLQGSAAQRLYERHGFELETQDEVDVFMVRRPQGSAG